ncbi:MAG: DUF4294 domain-containing protein [Bacteroidales bacterium]|nr:DUF4294 domain-containing protein [Bacteroidales bacterium]
MKKRIPALLTVLLLLLAGGRAFGQNHVREAMKRAKERQEALARARISEESPATISGGYLPYIVENGDTTYYDALDPIWIFARGKSTERDWKKYYKLVYNFAKVYPYAEASGRLKEIVDSTMAAEGMGRAKREVYMNKVQKMLFVDFEGALRHMTISQGGVLLKLIDRETGLSPYDIIHDYKNSMAAGFWQAVAKFFDNDLKSQYDPEGADRDLEELVQMWKAGTFERYYWSIFWEDPPKVTVPEFYKK